MALIFKPRFWVSGGGIALLLLFCPSLQAQGVFQGDTTGTAFGDGSTVAGVGLPKSTSISDFVSFETAQSVAQQAVKIANAMQTNSFGQNISPEAQQILLSLLTDPGFDTGSALTEKLKTVGISTELARSLSDRLERLFNPSTNRLKKWQIDSKLSVDVEQLGQAVKILNQVIEAANPQTLANPPDEFVVIQKVLAQLVTSTN